MCPATLSPNGLPLKPAHNSGDQALLQPRANRILAALPPDEYARMLPDLELVTLSSGQVLYNADSPIEHIYFPLTSLLSLLAPSMDGTSVEVACIGNEGIGGLPIFLGLESDTNQAITQVSGHALRMTVRAFRAALQHGNALFVVLQRFTQVLLIHMGQSAVCNRLHPINERCARWLLESQDRVQRDTFDLTQDFLAAMLGTRRASVTVAAGMLQEAGLIQYRRGRITIVDRQRLEQASCECYAVIAKATTRLLGNPLHAAH